MRWIDTALCRAMIADAARCDRPQGHEFSVLPRGGLIGVLIVAVSCIIIVSRILAGDPSGGSYLFPWLIGAPSVLLTLWARGIAKPAIERRQAALNDEVSQDSPRLSSFLFYLRPFLGDGRRPVTTRAASGSVAVLFGFGIDFELMLSQALRWTLPIVALGNSRHSKGAGRKIVDDESWQSAFFRLCDQCAAVACIPGASESSLWELEQINSRPQLLQKVIFFMPPRLGLRPWRVIPEIIGGRSRRRWDAIRDACRKFGMHLPVYKPAGCAFFLGLDSRPIVTCGLWGFDAARVETLCFAAIVRPRLNPEDFRIGAAALSAARPWPQRVVAFLLSRHTLTLGIWMPIAVGTALLLARGTELLVISCNL